MAALAVWLVRIAHRERLTAACLAAILGGALGNLVDRVRLGYVIDFSISTPPAGTGPPSTSPTPRSPAARCA